MIHTKNHKQGYLFDPWAHLGPKRRMLLDESWAGLFREHVLEELPVDELMPYFKEDFGRPTKELYAMMGAVILQQAHDLTDKETIAEVAFDEQWHYALNITSESDEAAYICPKTLYNMHRLFINNNIHERIFDKIAGKLAEVFGVDTNKQRLDSKHIKSDMARLGRIGIIARTVAKFLVNLKRQRRDLFDGLDEELTGKYMTQSSLGCFSMVKPSESGKRLAEVAQDLFDLSVRFSGNEAVSGMSSFQLLLRVLREQCKVTANEAGEPVAVEPKPCKEVPADSLQNPSDPDAGYDAHKGQGYRMRAGVEATMSGLDRMTNIKRLRVRGLPAVRFAAFLKATAVNIFRATAVRAARKAANSSLAGLVSFILRPVYVFKERSHHLWRKTRIIFIPSQINLQPEARSAS